MAGNEKATAHVIIKVGLDIFPDLDRRRYFRLWRHSRRERRYSANSVLHLRGHLPGATRFGLDGRPKRLTSAASLPGRRPQTRSIRGKPHSVRLLLYLVGPSLLARNTS